MVRRVKYIVCWFFLIVCCPSLAQRIELSNNPNEFINSLDTLLKSTKNSAIAALADDISGLWQGFGPDIRKKVMDHAFAMQDKGYKTRPYFENYFTALYNALETEKVNDRKLIGFLNVTSKVIDNHEPKDLLSYLVNINDFFENRALHYSVINQLYVENDNYDFEYIEYEAPEEVIIPEPEPEDELVEDDDEDFFEDWDEGDTETDWGTDWDDDESFEDPVEEEIGEGPEGEDLIQLAQPSILPPINGAVIKFNQTDLIISGPRDTTSIKGTQGSFIIIDKIFVGEGGKFNWELVDLSKDSVFVEFSSYAFDTRHPILEADQVKLTYVERLELPIDGVFEYNGKVRNENNYPRFKSYNNNIDVKNFGNSFLTYKGGFSLHGNRINSSSLFGGLATISVSDEAGPKFESKSRLFEIQDSIIIAKRASIIIFHKFDSIIHPTVRFNYNTNSEYLVLQKDKGGFKRTPYISTYFNMEIVADIIRWDVHSDSLDISILNARDEIPAVFKSIEFFDKNIVAGNTGLFEFNPLRMVVTYGKKRNNEFYSSDLASAVKIKESTIKTAMFYLMHAGYIDYNVNGGMVTLKPKANHNVKSLRGKKDFDSISIRSLTAKKPNATLNFDDQTMTVRGVDKFYLSEILDVYIEPDSSEITLLENRGFKYDGKIFAGNFEYIGKEFTFEYDSFLVRLNQIDSIRFYVMDENSRDSRRRQVDNTITGVSASDTTDSEVSVLKNIEGTSGTLYINKPNNKSGKKYFANYPTFDGTGSGSMAYFDHANYLNGAYDRSVYFSMPPFKIDSLSDSDPSSVGFDGTFNSSGMFTPFKEKLHIMPDYSLGFEHSVPPEGYFLYNGEGKLYNRLSLDKRGIRADGRIEFLTTTVNSNDFIFYPDSVTTIGSVADIKEEEYGGLIFPRVHVENYRMKWLPRKDSMYIYNLGNPIEFYDNTASLDGATIVSRTGISGTGTLLTRGSESISKQFSFDHDGFSARRAKFEIKTSVPDKPALAANDVKINFDLKANKAEISPEIAGVAAFEFPYAQFRTSITKAIWDLDSAKVTMSKPELVDLEDSYFYTTREDLDSLSFNATNAIYDIKTQELKVSGIPYITVADARITPENGVVLILENSIIETLHNTTLVIDTLDAFHRLYDGDITIISRNEFEGEATYEFINAVEDTFSIRLTNFRLANVSSKKRGEELHTVADGTIAIDDNLIVSPGMYYKGTIKMYADRPALELDGFVKLDLKKLPNYNTWIRYQHSEEQQEVIFDFESSQTENGQSLVAGLHFDVQDFGLYSTFVTDKRSSNDEDFFYPKGNLKYFPDSAEFVIIEPGKEDGSTLSGRVFAYNENNSNIRLEGPLNFIDNTKSVGITASGLGFGNLETNEFEFNTFMIVTFDVPANAFGMMAQDIKQEIDEFGAPEGLGDKTDLLYKIANLIGDRATSAYEKNTSGDYVPLLSSSPNMIRPLVFSDVNIKWSDEHKAFYSVGDVGLSHILRNDINAAFEGFIEIQKSLDGDRINIFIKASAESWYFFSYEDSKLLIYSSNKEFNDFISSKSNAAKAKIGEFIYAPGDIGETLDFINRFRLDYLGIDELYELSAPLDGQEDDKKTETDDDDDGFEDDDGF